MTSIEALKKLCDNCEQKMLHNNQRCPFRSISNDYCEEFEIIEKDLSFVELCLDKGGKYGNLKRRNQKNKER